MIACVCHNVSDKKIKKLVHEKKISTVKQLQKEINICNQCKICASDIQKIVKTEFLKLPNPPSSVNIDYIPGCLVN